MTETQKNIQNYKALLPGLKEKVLAAAMLLVVSMSMVVSASFAWITLSMAPEVANVTTNIAANGNLEIALADSKGNVPGVSQVGDSSAADGQNLLAANITWGNLVNLSDPAYGLSNIVLRPALLSNASNLLQQPLKGANYGDDGRMELYYNEDFQFTNWTVLDSGEGRFEFYEPARYGVRAISTIKYEYTNDTYYQFSQLMKIADNKLANTNTLYSKLFAKTSSGENNAYIKALAALIGQFMTDKLNESDTDVKSYMTSIYNLLKEFETAVLSFEDVLVALANTQVYNKYGPEDYATFTYTKDSFHVATDAELKANGVSLTSLSKYRTILDKTQKVLYGDGDAATLDSIQDYYNEANSGRSVMMSVLLPYVNELVNINSCQIILGNGDTYVVGSLGMSAATQLLGKDVDAKITTGVLKDFEQLSGCKMRATDVEVKAKYILTVTMKAKTITTNALDPYQYNIDKNAIEEAASANKTYKATAQDTYGMAIDFWIRTNAANSHLILEGNVLTKTETVRATGVDLDGNQVNLYTITVTSTFENEEGGTETVTEDIAVYQRTESMEDGTTKTVWRNSNDHSILDLDNPPEGLSYSTPIERMTDISSVIGYEGENRVWDDNMFLDTDSTTQGGGSCYVFYAEDPGQQEYCLRLLKNLRVAFLDGNSGSDTYGRMIAIAQLDIENRFEENGKVTLPLVLIDDGSDYLTTTENGLAIAALEKNVPSLLTAIVFLDGREISNSDVLAANDIQGQLNLQFGSTVELNAVENEDLQLATRSVSVVASKDPANYPSIDPVSNSTLEFDFGMDEDLTVYVKMAVKGEHPTSATAFFMRKVNDTQGSRETSFPLTKGEDGYWYGQYTFSAPGEYILRTVLLDGDDYTLPNTAGAYPTVKIAGFAMEKVSVTYAGREITEQAYTIMTGDPQVAMDLALSFKDDQKILPRSVRLQFLKDDGTQVTATLNYNSTDQKWSGTANFTSSGVYELRYVIMDGEYTELNPLDQRELTMYMGMTVKVTDTGEFRDILYEGNSITVPADVEIYDNTGAKIRYLNNVNLVYVQGNSNVDGMSPALRWNSVKDCYTTNLQIPGPGIYTFNSVRVGNSILKRVTEATPVYTCMSPNTPTYFDADPMIGKDYLLSAEGQNGTYNVLSVGIRMQDADAATITAMIRNKEEEKLYPVTATASTKETIDGKAIATFEFILPKTNGNYQSGDWVIEKLELVNVFSKDENDMPIKHGADNPYVIDLTKTEINNGDDLAVKVVNAIVEVTAADENLDGGAFMGSATAENAIIVKITDHKGKKLDSNYIDIADLKITFKYTPQSSQTYGHYIATNGEAVEDIVLIPASNDGMTYTMNKMQLGYAGEYLADSLTFTVSDKTGTSSQNFVYTSDERESVNLGKLVIEELPRYTLSTEAPTVTISTVSTNASTDRYYLSSTPSSLNVITGSYNWKSEDGFSATVYMYSAEQSGIYDHECLIVKYPAVKLSLSGIPVTHSGVKMTFGNATNNSKSSTFEFASGSMNATATIGAGTNGTYNTGYTGLGFNIETYPKFYPAGKQTVSQIIVTYGGVDYTVDLTNAVTINNPQHPPFADFVIDDLAYAGTVPSRVYSTNGETIVLPDIENWTNYNVATALSTKNYPEPTTSSAGTYYYDRGLWRYYTYTRTKYTQSCTVSSQIDDITYKLQWKVGNTLYDPGTEIPISGAVTITGVVTEVSRVYVDTQTVTYTKTWYIYTRTGTSKSGTKISFTPNESTKYDASNNVYNESEVVS